MKLLRAFLVLGAIAGLATTSPAEAQLIISDNFQTATLETAITGRTPNVSLPGSTWQQPSPWGGLNARGNAAFTAPVSPGNPSPGLFGSDQNASAISIASVGLYVKPVTLRITADIAPRDISNNIGGNLAGSPTSAPFRGAGLGYYSTSNPALSQYTQHKFTGLVFDSTGALSFATDPGSTGFPSSSATWSAPVAYGGTFNPNQYYTLSYDIDTITGGITNVSLSGSTANYSSLMAASVGYFTNAATNYAGIYTSGVTSGHQALFDNFSLQSVPVAVVPEPASYAAWLVGGVGLAAVWGLRRRRAQG